MAPGVIGSPVAGRSACAVSCWGPWAFRDPWGSSALCWGFLRSFGPIFAKYTRLVVPGGGVLFWAPVGWARWSVFCRLLRVCWFPPAGRFQACLLCGLGRLGLSLGIWRTGRAKIGRRFPCLLAFWRYVPPDVCGHRQLPFVPCRDWFFWGPQLGGWSRLWLWLHVPGLVVRFCYRLYCRVFAGCRVTSLGSLIAIVGGTLLLVGLPVWR